MRVLAAFVFCIAATASAQTGPPDAARSRPTTGERAVIVAGAVGGGFLVGVAFPPAAPLGVAAGTYGSSAALGLDPSLGEVVVDTALGTLVGASAGMLWYL